MRRLSSAGRNEEHVRAQLVSQKCSSAPIFKDCTTVPLRKPGHDVAKCSRQIRVFDCPQSSREIS